jgi:hypothetical protein
MVSLKKIQINFLFSYRAYRVHRLGNMFTCGVTPKTFKNKKSLQIKINYMKCLKLLVVPKRRNSVDGKRKTKRRKFRTKRRKLLKISLKVPKKRNFFFKIRKSKKTKFFLNLYKMLSLMKIYGMYFSEGPNFLLVWGQHFASGCQNFASEVSKFC